MVTVFPPVGLDEHAIDLFEVHDAGLVAHRLDEGTQAEIARAAQGPSPERTDQSERFLGESHLWHEFKRFFGVPPQTFAPHHGGNHTAGLASRETPARRLPAPRQSSVAVTIHPSQVTQSRLDKKVAFRQLATIDYHASSLAG